MKSLGILAFALFLLWLTAEIAQSLPLGNIRSMPLVLLMASLYAGSWIGTEGRT